MSFIRLGFALLATFTITFASAQETNSLKTNVPQENRRSVLDSMILGWKSYNTVARFRDLNDRKDDPSKGRFLKSKHEFQLGYRWPGDWGTYLQTSQTRSEYRDRELNKWAAGDPSLTLTHPSLYQDSNLRIGGSARAYFPMTERSKDYDTRQYAYYSTMNYQLTDNSDLFNIFIPRWFVTNRYSSSDTTFYIEDRTIYTRKFAPWGRWSIGQWTQYEVHAAQSPGMTIDVIPQFDYLLTSKVFFGPRLSLPVYVKNSVYEGAKQVSLENAYFEFYLQASL